MDTNIFLGAIGGMAATITAMWFFIKRTYLESKKEQSEWRNLLIKQTERAEKVTGQFNQTIVDVTNRYEKSVISNTAILMKLDATDGLDSAQVQRIGDQVQDISQTMERISNSQDRIVANMELMRTEIIAELKNLPKTG